MTLSRVMVRLVAALAISFSVGVIYAKAESRPVMVFAAASLKNAMDDVKAAWGQATGKSATIVYAASNVLAKQIEAGAPADLFVSADLDWMDYAASKNLIEPSSRINLLGNALVLIAPTDTTQTVPQSGDLNLSALLGSDRLALAYVDAVPAGRYGKAALEKLGQWEVVRDRIAQAESVRAALLLVSRGETPLGVVYRSDAVTDPRVRIIFEFPVDAHPPIVYPAAVMRGMSQTDAAQFLSFLQSETAKSLFEKHGFVVLNQPASRS